ncbi:hypothetical protein [Ralstonia phage phiRSL1]|uniref:DUF2116 family Zn-ribbon domain-containing protein n=1 Tax=Ralstonia phage phiRSL1 TaxID=1980924 RepID=B2ZY68_9CAUD|nr:DksA-like zinc-finger protein [Ralstonia phage phiRSL1]BAG41636.1 hypothetical protein [Ralstonia phage phiRSL1]
MDDIDRIQDRYDHEHQQAINKIRERAKKSLMPTGHCFFCGEQVKHPLLFCDSFCRDDYEREQRSRRINGL